MERVVLNGPLCLTILRKNSEKFNKYFAIFYKTLSDSDIAFLPGMDYDNRGGIKMDFDSVFDRVNDFIAVKAEEDGVSIIGLTRGKDTRFHHTEKLDKGEVYIAEFTEMTSAMKIKGKAKIYCKHGIIESE